MDRNKVMGYEIQRPGDVALLAEGVDRNMVKAPVVLVELPSPSSRRAWIEIPCAAAACAYAAVALLAEGVDRNFTATKTPMTRRVALLAEGVDRNFRAR